MPVKFAKEGNEFGYLNLPPDYGELTGPGQAMARVNAVQLYGESPDYLVGAWSLMATYYLMDDPEDGFQPAYYKRYKASPPLHYQMVWWIGRHTFNVFGLPRSFAKSTVMMTLAFVPFLGGRNFYTLFVYSSEKMVHDRFEGVFLHQLKSNRRIVQDFGDVEPKMGSGAWNRSRIRNGKTRSLLGGMPVRGALYGPRPDQVILDDCEFDFQLQKTTTELIQQMDGLMHNTLLPMVDEGGSAVTVLGTLHNNRTWISRWLRASAKDEPRVGLWNRMLCGAEDRREDGKLLWEEKYNEKVLARSKAILGRAYSTQRLNKPEGENEAVLAIHPQLCQYEVKDQDERYAVRDGRATPLDSKALLVSWKVTEDRVERIERPFGETVSRMFRVILMDDARCKTATSDMVCFLVLGVESSAWYKDTWWLLDVWLGRVVGEGKYRLLMDLAARWRVKYLGIEAVAAQEEVVRNAEEYLPEMAAALGWNPRVYPITYPSGVSKADRINALEWRFNQYRVKYPAHLKNEAMWRLMYSQTTGWTGEEGCIPYDDGIDTLAMAPVLLGRKKHAQIDVLPSTQSVDLVEALKRDRREEVIPGVPVGLGLAPSEVPRDVLQSMINEEHNRLRGRIDPWKARSPFQIRMKNIRAIRSRMKDGR